MMTDKALYTKHPEEKLKSYDRNSNQHLSERDIN